MTDADLLPGIKNWGHQVILDLIEKKYNHMSCIIFKASWME